MASLLHGKKMWVIYQGNAPFGPNLLQVLVLPYSIYSFMTRKSGTSLDALKRLQAATAAEPASELLKRIRQKG